MSLTSSFNDCQHVLDIPNSLGMPLVSPYWNYKLDELESTNSF